MFEVETVLDLFTRLIERVVEFLRIYARDHVERRIARQSLLLSKREGLLDDVSRLAELSSVLAVDVDFHAAGVTDSHQGVLSVKRP